MKKALHGNLLVGQSGGPTAVINASLAGVVHEAQRNRCFGRVYGLVHGIEGALHNELIELSNETRDNLAQLSRTPSSALGSCRHKLREEDFDPILEVFRSHDIRHFIYIGGNDSMDTCHRIWSAAADANHEIQVAGVPKTVDNDVARTDHCPGYGSAARFYALTARDAGRDLEAMATFDDVTILETMGRNAGWLAASTVLAKTTEHEAPNLVYVPEVSFEEGKFLESVARVHSRLGRVFVVVSEGLRDAQGDFVGAKDSDKTDEFGHVLHQLSTGVAAYLNERIHTELALRSRFLRPGLIGRSLSACRSEIDLDEAWKVGQEAVRYLSEGRSGEMVVLERRSSQPYACEVGFAPLQEVANEEHLLPADWVSSEGSGMEDEFWEYASPLVGKLESLARVQGAKI